MVPVASAGEEAGVAAVGLVVGRAVASESPAFDPEQAAPSSANVTTADGLGPSRRSRIEWSVLFFDHHTNRCTAVTGLTGDP
jgi:hypothetical protein